MSDENDKVIGPKKYKRYKLYKFVTYAALFVAALTVAALVFGWLIMLLWNATITEIFNVAEISFWQGIGLYILAKLFFGFGSISGGKPKTGKNFDWKKFRDKSLRSKGFQEYWEEEGRAAYENYRSGKNDEAGQNPS